jgi:beta-carotene ketolase (CrtW type)
MGLIISIAIIVGWAAHLLWSVLQVQVSWTNPWMYVHLLVQAYLYTGLFITGHDAIHNNISSRRRVNAFLGKLTAWLYAGLSYRKLYSGHMDHHRYPGTPKDPDYAGKSQNFFLWWGRFMSHYLTLWQILIMALIYNAGVILLNLSPANLVAFWIIPSFLSTFQLFYFGTYRPHRLPHEEEMGPHRARSQTRNHIWAMLSCYFFGYHREHHEHPGVPWWKLYQMK